MLIFLQVTAVSVISHRFRGLHNMTYDITNLEGWGFSPPSPLPGVTPAMGSLFMLVS